MAGDDRLNTGAHTPSGKSMYSLGGCVRGDDVSTHEDHPPTGITMRQGIAEARWIGLASRNGYKMWMGIFLCHWTIIAVGPAGSIQFSRLFQIVVALSFLRKNTINMTCCAC